MKLIDRSSGKLTRRLSIRSRIIRWFLIGIISVPIASSFFNDRGYHLKLFSCPIRRWTGVICPSCGMTRSFEAIAHGDWRSAIDYHLFGPPLFISLTIGLIHLSCELLLGHSLQLAYLGWLNRSSLQLVIFISFSVYYLLRINDYISIYHL